MSTNTRGFLIFGALVLVVAFVCIGPAFFWLPRAGLGVPLPVIALPGEVLAGNVFPGFLGYDLTNTITSMILVDIILLIMGLTVWRATSGQSPDRFVPKGFTNFIELIAEFLYNQAKGMLGAQVGRVFPLAASIFLFLLVANWIKLIPGVESIGIISCAEPGQPGYGIKGYNEGLPGTILNVNQMDLGGRAGTKATPDDTHACEEKYPQFTPPLVIAKQARGETAEHTDGPSETAPAAEGTAPAESGESPANPTHESGFAPSQTNVVYRPNSDKAEVSAETGNPELFVVVPFFRALATDLNLPLGLALIVVLAVQIWGVWSLGPAYFFKFINIPALGNLSKKPLGLIDFIVGLVEIISEISRVISLSFRLFGNIFAGGVLLIVMTFLVAGGLPSVFYFLEIFVGLIQAYVFSILTLIYASQAVVGHHGDDHDDHGHADHGHDMPVEHAELP
jgi:F-type H+-transporting ATPase subunit a